MATGPVVTTWTDTPSRSTSAARARAKALSPAFDAEYAERPGWGACDELDERKIMRPPAGMTGSAALATTKADVRLVRSTDSNVASDSLRTNVPAITPAACTSRSTEPASATTPAKASGSPLSAATHRAPTSAAAASSVAGVRAVSTTS